MNVYRVRREGYMLVAADSEPEAREKCAVHEDDEGPLGFIVADLQAENVPDEELAADPDVLR